MEPLNCLCVCVVVCLWVQGLGHKIPRLSQRVVLDMVSSVTLAVCSAVCIRGRITVHICVDVNNPPPLHPPTLLLSFLPSFSIFCSASVFNSLGRCKIIYI